MTVLQTIGAMVGIIVSLGVLIAGCGYAYAQYRRGGKEADKENQDAQGKVLDDNTKTLTLLRSQLEALQKSTTEQDEKIRILRGEVQSLKTLIEEKDRKLTEYIRIIQGKDPKLEETLNTILHFITESKAYMTKNEQAIDHIKSVTDRLLGPANPTPPVK